MHTAEETDSEIGRVCNFQTSMTLTLNWVIRHIIVYHSSTSTYILNLVEIRNFLWTDRHTYGQMDIETNFIR